MGTTVDDWLAGGDVSPATAPFAVAAIVDRMVQAPADDLSRNDPPAIEVAARQAAVLILLGTDGPEDVDVLLQKRASGLRDHAGEISFPGGSREGGDAGPAETALREAAEETGLDPTGVEPLAILPCLHIPPSRFDVTGVLAYWRRPSAVVPADVGETAAVMSVPLARLADPRNRLDFETDFGWKGPAFRIDDEIAWGYTGEILAALVRFGTGQGAPG
jgi:8-oxo-dGTP pyrophosphatase MutT (NUDIX family)